MPEGPAELMRILFLFVYAFLFAAAEIEIEGPHGWAERLPTWYRVRPGYARLFGALTGGKPLTGYHATMLPLSLASFHLGFVGGVPWSGSAEATTLAAYLAWLVIWDFLWFVLNPTFTWARFRKGAVWWHDGRWIGRFPADYPRAFAASLLIAALGALGAGGARVLIAHIVLVAGMCALAAAATWASPLYHRWHRYMRRDGADDRPLVRTNGQGRPHVDASADADADGDAGTDLRE
jgi:hypothetical protein